MKRAIVLFLFFSSFGGAASADTGTYRILDYRVRLTPHSNGTVDIEYYQKWLVTGGNIPWITVGTPNESFQISEYGGVVNRITSANQGGWSGVRLDLDRDYQPGQVFEISFSIYQDNLFYADQESYRLEFTPGWYDRTITDTLLVSVKFFAKMETVDASPQPTSISGEEMIWVRHNLGKGERFSISISFPQKLFPGVVGKSKPENTSWVIKSLLIIFAIIFLIVIVLILGACLLPPGEGYSGGRIFYGGFGSGLPGAGKSSVGDSRSTGKGGGFGGASISCACACVSCACACACAGGGGAGCSRKTRHICRLCKKRRN